MAHRHGNRPEAEHVRRGLNWFVGAVALVTVLGVVVLWPRGEGPDLGASTQGLVYVDATVTRSTPPTAPTSTSYSRPSARR